ncbi:hypothetical protein TNCV_2995341 [Trichonephila clavipes]|nr:hypothetical protein TNCV_2995341 [Trichonephila clavipes]
MVFFSISELPFCETLNVLHSVQIQRIRLPSTGIGIDYFGHIITFTQFEPCDLKCCPALRFHFQLGRQMPHVRVQLIRNFYQISLQLSQSVLLHLRVPESRREQSSKHNTILISL